jgi:hypothetical protein
MELVRFRCRIEFSFNRDPSDEICFRYENFQINETPQKFDNNAIDEDFDLYTFGISCIAWWSLGSRYVFFHDFRHFGYFSLGWQHP